MYLRSAVFGAVVTALAIGQAIANEKLSVLDRANPIDEYVNVGQQGYGEDVSFVTCDRYIDDCPKRTVKHRAEPLRGDQNSNDRNTVRNLGR